MTELRSGDRVHVEYDATVCDLTGPGGCIRGTEGTHCDVPADAVLTRIAPVFKVGDPIETREQLDDLPDGAVLVPVRLGFAVGTKIKGEWHLTNGARNSPSLPARLVALRGEDK